jgi:transposase-like protein
MYDRRRKLTDQQYEEIRERYANGIESISALAREYGVCNRTIHIICRPEVKELLNERAKAYRKAHPIPKELNRERVRKTREWQRNGNSNNGSGDDGKI